MKHEETARRLRSALTKSGLSQQELAEKSGVSKASISQYINGTHIPGNKKAGMIAEVLGCSPLWLMGFDVEDNAPLRENKNIQRFMELLEPLSEEEQERLFNIMKMIINERK